MRPRKITLAQAQQSGAEGLLIACAADAVNGPGCRHAATMTLGEALARFGPDRRLDALGFKCSACGRSVVDVRPAYRGGEARGDGAHSIASPMSRR